MSAMDGDEGKRSILYRCPGRQLPHYLQTEHGAMIRESWPWKKALLKDGEIIDR